MLFFSCLLLLPLALSPANLPSAPYAPWAHSHWVWLSSSQANQSTLIDLVEQYLARNISVGAVDVDSQWATHDNDFQWNLQKYPNPSGMIRYFHSLGVRVIAWTTSVVNTDSPTYPIGVEKGYFLNDGRTVHWWHGEGAFIDYTNPEAVEWWHKQLDGPLNDGLDGWKCDGTDPFIFLLGIAYGKGGIVSEREYANMYYRDFLFYSRTRNPDALIMARPVDTDWSFAPQDVMFSGWVGDQDPTFDGMKEALTDFMRSAWRGYANYGSDIGGYRGGQRREKPVFVRWYQLGAFVPLMENGGNGPHQPWAYGDDVVANYKFYVDTHLSLMNFFLSAGTHAILHNTSVLHPCAFDDDPLPLPLTSYAYTMGPNDELFVFPIVNNDTTADIKFPDNNNWISFWNTSQKFVGGSTVTYPLSLWQLPVFNKQGSVLPRGNHTFIIAGYNPARPHGRFALYEYSPVGAPGGVIFEYTYNATDHCAHWTMTPSTSTLPFEFVIQLIHVVPVSNEKPSILVNGVGEVRATLHKGDGITNVYEVRGNGHDGLDAFVCGLSSPLS